jgi:hypothetical protein
MPEAPIYKYREVPFWKYEIRLTQKRPFPAPTFNLIGPKNSYHSEFSALIASRSNRRHDTGSDLS